MLRHYGPGGPSARAGGSAVWSRGLDGTASLVLAAGMLGATVMPHAIYLHGALTAGRYAGTPREDSAERYTSQRWMSCRDGARRAGQPRDGGRRRARAGGPPADTLEAAHNASATRSAVAALLFALALLATGLAASSRRH